MLLVDNEIPTCVLFLNPKVSIIIPVYNAENTLDACIRSVLQVDYPNYELILVDDGSKDHSWDICCKWANQDSRVKALHQENEGPSSARNRGISESSGKWIMFVDSDDTVRPSYVSDLLNVVETDSSFVMAISGEQVYRNGQKAEEVRFPDLQCLVKDHKTLWKDIRLYKFGHPFGKLYRKDIIEKAHLHFDKTVCLEEDCIFMMQYIMACSTISNAKIAFISKMNYDYFIHAGSVSTRRSTLNQEKANYSVYRKTIFQLRDVFDIDDETFNCMFKSIAYYADRVMNTIADLPTRKERIGQLDIVDRFEYKQYKEAPTVAMVLLKYLFVSHHWFLYDIIRSKIK